MTTAIYAGLGGGEGDSGDRVRGSRWRVMVLQVPLAGDAWGGHNVAGSAEARARRPPRARAPANVMASPAGHD